MLKNFLAISTLSVVTDKFFLPTNQNLLLLKKKNRKIITSFSSLIAQINVANSTNKLYVYIIFTPFILNVLKLLVAKNIFFSWYLLEQQNKQNIVVPTKRVIVNFSSYGSSNYNPLIFYYYLFAIFFRYSIKYGHAFKKLVVFSTVARQTHISARQIKKYFVNSSNITNRVTVFNTVIGLLTHSDLINTKCGGTLLLQVLT